MNEAEYFGLRGPGQRMESCCRVAPFPAAAGRAEVIARHASDTATSVQTITGIAQDYATVGAFGFEGGLGPFDHRQRGQELESPTEKM